MSNKINICLYGCGNLGTAILNGVLEALGGKESNENKNFSIENISAITKTEKSCNVLSRVVKAPSNINFKAVSTNEHLEECYELIKESNIIILGVKPQVYKQALNSVIEYKKNEDIFKGKLVVSLMAGISIKKISDFISSDALVIRALPNTPCRVRDGMTVITPLIFPSNDKNNVIENSVKNLQISAYDCVKWIFSSVGKCITLPESQFDVVTALSGSGPAFTYVYIQSLAEGGVKMGLPYTTALELAAHTVHGASSMVLDPHASGNSSNNVSLSHPEVLKSQVTSPAGTTIAGLSSLDALGFRYAAAKAVESATIRSRELS